MCNISNKISKNIIHENMLKNHLKNHNNSKQKYNKIYQSYPSLNSFFRYNIITNLNHQQRNWFNHNFEHFLNLKGLFKVVLLNNLGKIEPTITFNCNFCLKIILKVLLFLNHLLIHEIESLISKQIIQICFDIDLGAVI